MMDLLSTMRFVRGAVHESSVVSDLKHFRINDGFIKAFNGVIALNSPIDFGVNCMPLAEPLVRAIGCCNDVLSLGMTDGGRLRIQSGKFRAFIECLEEEVLPIEPQGELVEIDGSALVVGLRTVMPFIGNDASRPWVNGVLLRGRSAFATNNVCVIEYWIGSELPMMANIPIDAVKELVRIDPPPSHAQICESSITFHYPDGRWLKTQLYDTNWPELARILERPSNPVPLPVGLFEALLEIRPFAEKNGNVFIRDGAIHTQETEGLGASYQVEGLPETGIYKIDMLRLLKSATHADLSTYPEPCMFYGDKIRGAIIGLRP